MTKKFAVILSGCGVFDGSEIHESVLAFLAISNNDGTYQCFAPNIEQSEVINHYKQEKSQEKRNVLVEAARIARGNIKKLSELNIEDFDAVIFPGGFGAAKNFSNLAFAGADFNINDEIAKTVLTFHQAKKAIGAICISPAFVAKILSENNITIKATMGSAENCETYFNSPNIKAETKEVAEISIDEANKLVTTPAYMYEAKISEISLGINKMIKYIIDNF